MLNNILKSIFSNIYQTYITQEMFNYPKAHINFNVKILLLS